MACLPGVFHLAAAAGLVGPAAYASVWEGRLAGREEAKPPPAASVARFDVSPHSPPLTGACRRASRSADSRPHTGTFLTRRRAQGPLSASPKDSEPLRKPGTAGRRRRTWRARNAPTCVGSAMDQTGLGTHAAAPPYASRIARWPRSDQPTPRRRRGHDQGGETIGRYWYGCGSTCARPDRTGRASRWRRPSCPFLSSLTVQRDTTARLRRNGGAPETEPSGTPGSRRPVWITHRRRAHGRMPSPMKSMRQPTRWQLDSPRRTFSPHWQISACASSTH